MRAEFQRAHACPATGRHRGACPGYQVDHIRPLKCGGPDRPENMQWLTVEQHKEKTGREAPLCRRAK
jgi:5-methylcytosine-specific restriction endonuclease McrA